MAYAVASDDALLLAVLSSRPHQIWVLQTGGTLEDRPRYNSRLTFTPFPFPDCTEAQKARIRELGEQLDGHRKRQQALHPKLTLTDMYNVLEKLRSGAELTAKERTIHEQGLVSVLRQLHDDLDAAVFDAYGWAATLADDEILQRLVALNAERAAEEAGGLIRWLRPDFQNPSASREKQNRLTLADDEGAGEADGAKAAAKSRGKPGQKKAAKREWPKGREAQAKAVLAALRDCEVPIAAGELARQFARALRLRWKSCCKLR